MTVASQPAAGRPARPAGALTFGSTAHAAFEGIGRPKTGLRIVAAMYPGPGMEER